MHSTVPKFSLVSSPTSSKRIFAICDKNFFEQSLKILFHLNGQYKNIQTFSSNNQFIISFHCVIFCHGRWIEISSKKMFQCKKKKLFSFCQLYKYSLQNLFPLRNSFFFLQQSTYIDIFYIIRFILGNAIYSRRARGMPLFWQFDWNLRKFVENFCQKPPLFVKNLRYLSKTSVICQKPLLFVENPQKFVKCFWYLSKASDTFQKPPKYCEKPLKFVKNCWNL